MEVDTKTVKKFFPGGYNRRKVNIDPRGKVTLLDLNWSGGTRSIYKVFDIETAQRVSDTEKYSQMAPWNNPAEGVTLPIPKGCVVVRTGFFCGKVSLATIYCNPEDMPRLLT